MKEYRGLWLILVLFVGIFVKSSCSKCSKKTDCKAREICCGSICCGSTCRAGEKCLSLCITDSQCPADQRCEHHYCAPIPNSYTSTDSVKSCSSDGDCDDITEQHSQCCRKGKCTTTCLAPTTTPPTSRSSCISWRDCAHGEQCKGGSCSKTSNVMLTKAGFLSAAILTGSVFLLILCCCFVRESKYGRQRYADRHRRRSRRRSRHGRRRSSHQTRSRSGTVELRTTAVENRAFSIDDCHCCEAGLPIAPPEYPGERNEGTSDGNHPSGEPLPPSPPPYCTLSFDLPPTYEEALQTEANRGSLTAVA